MAFDMLYPDEKKDQVHRHSSIDQFGEFLSVMVKGGWAPIVFDQLDGINCQTIISHPVIISWNDSIGYVFPEAHCTYASDHFVYFDKEAVEEKVLPECFGAGGEFYYEYIKSNSFVNFSIDSSVGAHNEKRLRTGLSYVIADKNLPPAD